MPVIGYIPYDGGTVSVEALFVRDYFGCSVLLPAGIPRLNGPAVNALPPTRAMREMLAPLVAADWLIAEGPAGFLWTAVLRDQGFAGGATLLPYLNPRRWQDVADAVVYTRFQDPRDRVYLGSTPSARIYRRLGVRAAVGEPYGIDDQRFRPRPRAANVLTRLRIPPGALLLFAGRAQSDKDLCRLLRIALKARILFPDLQIVFASHVVDEAYLTTIRRKLGPDAGVHFVQRPDSEDLADLYCVADVFVTAATSHFETFGRALAEALCCGTPVVAPRYDGFAEVLAQPGGRLVDVGMDVSGPHVREDEMLRAIYEVLSGQDRVSRSLVSSVARSRFGRSQTIELLAHIVKSDKVPDIDLADASSVLNLPPAWDHELRTLARLPHGEVLERVWRFHGDEFNSNELSAWDGCYVDSVRRALCVTEPRGSSSVPAREVGGAA